MKYTTQICLLFFLLSFKISGQNISGIIKYSETLQLGNKIERDNILYFNSNSSFFEKIDQTVTDNLSEEKKSLYKKCKRITYLNLKNKDYYFTYAVGSDNTIVKDSLVLIDWKLFSDSKMIGKFNCQKATGKFRGRNYTAWFTPDIPIQFGPWKIFGLPGLILEVIEENNAYHVIATDIALDTNVNTIIESKIIESNFESAISFKEYKEKIANAQSEYRKLVQSKMPKGETAKWQPEEEKSKPLEILE